MAGCSSPVEHLSHAPDATRGWSRRVSQRWLARVIQLSMGISALLAIFALFVDTPSTMMAVLISVSVPHTSRHCPNRSPTCARRPPPLVGCARIYIR